MANKAHLECASNFLSSVMSNDLPSEGGSFVSVGDFCQVAPVVQMTSYSSLRVIRSIQAVFDGSIRSSLIWYSLTILRLHAHVRNARDLEF